MGSRHAALLVSAAALVLPASASAQEADKLISSENVSHVANIGYEARDDKTPPNYGTDIEFAEVRGRQYAFAGSYRNGMHIVDITDPAAARVVGVYDCGVTQGDVQVFRQDDEPGRVFVAYTSDTYGDGKSTCYSEAKALGFDVHKANGSGRNGSFIVDVSRPESPRTVSFIDIPQGSHNTTVHPSGDYLYNSNSDLITSYKPAIEVFDISRPAVPAKTGELDLPTRPGLGTESHDITFDERGDRAYSAALSQGVIIDTTEPAAPKVVTSFLDPTINVWHQSDPYSTTDASGKRRDFLFVEDEVAGALSTYQCPNGGVHVYEITGELEKHPKKVGYWNIAEAYPIAPGGSGNGGGRCTAHVFDIHEKAKTMTIAFYNGGVRVVDLSGLDGISVGGTQLVGEGMREVAHARFQDGGKSSPASDTWSVKTPRIHPVTGDMHLYANDINRGLDVFRVEGDGRPSKDKGRWMTPRQAEVALAGRSVPAGYSLFCLTGS